MALCNEINHFSGTHLDNDYLSKFDLFESVEKDLQEKNDTETPDEKVSYDGEIDGSFLQTLSSIPSNFNPATPDPYCFNSISDYNIVKNDINLNPQSSDFKVSSGIQVQENFLYAADSSTVITHTFSLHREYEHNKIIAQELNLQPTNQPWVNESHLI